MLKHRHSLTPLSYLFRGRSFLRRAISSAKHVLQPLEHGMIQINQQIRNQR